jgi:uncharacterized protein
LLLTEVDRKLLLDHSRCVLERSVRGQPAPHLQNLTPSLLAPNGVFVTLRQHDGELRGCIGRVITSQPLFQTVAECTVDAATADPRFNPVRAEEPAELYIEISVLSPLQEACQEAVELGRHGVVISVGSRRALLLPQVALEWGWDRERFLAETCLKAGLPFDAWRHGARIQTFTAEVFGEIRSDRTGPVPALVQLPLGNI